VPAVSEMFTAVSMKEVIGQDVSGTKCQGSVRVS
jgi:hypothetical protein